MAQMNVLNFLLLIFSHYILGWGILKAIGFKNVTTSLQYTLVAFMLGEGFSSLIPVLLEMIAVSINKSTLTITIILIDILPFIFWVKSILKIPVVLTGKNYFRKIRLYDVAFLFVLFFMLYVSIFKCAYYPPVPRDMISGPEAIAEYTVKEGHIINSYFSVDLTSTNNHQKPPYLLGLQILYKIFVQPFGQVWLIPLYTSFFLLFYSLARKTIHPILAGIATLLVLANPEFFGYTIMVLFDLPNALYVFIGFYYLYAYLKSEDKKELILGAIGFALATLVRAETIILVVFISGIYCIYQAIKSKKQFIKPALLFCFILLLPSLLIDIFSMEVFVKRVIPSGSNISGTLNDNLSNLSPLFQRLTDMIELLMFTDKTNPKVTYLSSQLYTETFDIMLFFIVLELGFVFFKRKLNFPATTWFFFMFLVFFFLGFIGYLIPLADLSNTSKRGLFKMIPLVFFFVIQTRAAQFISNAIIKWETR
jgi:4-amino-4-deoxy-L-arabinose transferase-like glycosyltransferase